MSAVRPRSTLRAVIWEFRRELLAVGVFSLVSNLLMLTPTLYMLQIFDRVTVSQNEFTLLALTLIAVSLYCIMAFAEWARTNLLVRLSVRIDQNLGDRIFFALFDSALKKTDVNSQGFADLTQLRQFLTGQVIFAIFDAPWVIVYMAALFILHPLIGVTAVVFAVLLIVLAVSTHVYTHEPLEQALESGAQSQGFVLAKLHHCEIIESLGMVENLRLRWQERHQRYLKENYLAQNRLYTMAAFSTFFRSIQQSLILAVSAILVIENEVTMGAMIAANMLMSRTLAPIDMMVNTWRLFVTARLAYRRLDGLLDHPARMAAPLAVSPTCAQIKISNLTATAPGRSKPILDNLTAAFNPGEIIVIVGPSGSGKSTLARCLIGIWSNYDGNVLLDGQPIQHWAREHLGPFIGYLPQEIELFEGSIAENIARFGAVNSEQVIKAARQAGIHDMVLRNLKGYDTQIGEAGHLLSAGQKQRIALARALYGSPGLIVLDEPNAHLDDAGEICLAKAVKELKAEGSVVFVISHRAQATSMADRILKLDNGRLVADFRRQELVVAA